MENKWITAKWHLIAILTVAIWGTTFISTKILIQNGLMPQDIFLLRFLVAYVGIWLISPRRLWADNWKDECWLMLCGLTGGSLYFLTENTALQLTQTANVAFIVCTTPLLTALLARFTSRNERPGNRLWMGSLIALAGVGMLVFNGSFVLRLSPLGDLLSLLAALAWACYSLLIRKMEGRYPTTFITRKVFFYGLVTILPVFYFQPWHYPMQGLLQPAVWGNLLFLSVVASLICFVVWNFVMKRLGILLASNYLYLNPLFTVVASLLFLDEQFTWLMLPGALCIVGGLWLSKKP